MYKRHAHCEQSRISSNIATHVKCPCACVCACTCLCACLCACYCAPQSAWAQWRCWQLCLHIWQRDLHSRRGSWWLRSHLACSSGVGTCVHATQCMQDNAQTMSASCKQDDAQVGYLMYATCMQHHLHHLYVWSGAVATCV